LKFFCEQCKAKYQIADEKVAGKTVRMKCRKCGHLIELRAEVTESSAIAHAPPAAPGTSSSGGLAGQAGAAARPSAPRAPARPPPKPNALATSLTSAKPAPPKADRSAGGALSGAFRNTVQREDEGSAPFDMADLAPGDDWYVAVNGVPVGPIRIAEVRRKAALGAVTEESLVWQEGLDEWRPLKTFPDLAANVREAAASGRVSITPPPPDVRPSAPPPPRAPSMRQSSANIPSRIASSRPLQTPPPAARSNVVPFTSRLATAERLDDAPTEIGALHRLTAAVADPFAAPAPAAIAPPSAAAMAPLGDGPPIVASASLAPPLRPDARSRKQPPWIVIAMIAGAVAFGAVAALSIFVKPSPPPAGVAQGAAAPPTPPPTAPASATGAATVAMVEPTASVAIVSAAPATHGGSGGAPRATTAAAPTIPGRSLDLHSLAGTNVAPSEDPGGGDAPSAPGQCISGGQVQQVIGLHQVAIRRACWERNPTVKPTVSVNVALTVGADGSAQGVSASGDEPSVAKCIENDVRGWHFPAMGCSQKTAFSLKFVKQ
jgi:predicted Zn finger-like uncharacterized protein